MRFPLTVNLLLDAVLHTGQLQVGVAAGRGAIRAQPDDPHLRGPVLRGNGPPGGEEVLAAADAPVDAEAQAATTAKRRPDRAGRQSLRVIDLVAAVEAETVVLVVAAGDAGAKAPFSACALDSRLKGADTLAPALDARVSSRDRPRRFREDADHAVDRVRPVLHAGRAPDDFDPIDLGEGDREQVPLDVPEERRVDRDIVDEHEELVGERPEREAPDRDGPVVAGALGDIDPRGERERLGDRAHAGAPDVLGADDPDRVVRLQQRLVETRRGRHLHVQEVLEGHPEDVGRRPGRSRGSAGVACGAGGEGQKERDDRGTCRLARRRAPGRTRRNS